jgi:hypothetical protein
VCLALAGWSRCRAAGAVLTLYAAIVLVASVYLGWHYAIDGYVSVVLVLGLWSLAGRIYDGRRTAAVRSAGSVSGGSVDAR